MTLIAAVAILVAGGVLILCLPTLAIAIVRGDGRTTLRLTVTVALCTLLTGLICADLAIAIHAGLPLEVGRLGTARR